MNYPSIMEDKQNLNSVLNDTSAKDVISLSCFSRPMNRTQKHVPSKSTMITPQAMMKLGYNFKLVPKQKESRLNEIIEIESIQRDLARKEIYIGNRVLQKAIIYDNERDTIKKFGKKVGPEGETIEEDDEFVVRYPGAGEQLLENPFAVKEKAKKGKKKKK